MLRCNAVLVTIKSSNPAQGKGPTLWTGLAYVQTVGHTLDMPRLPQNLVAQNLRKPGLAKEKIWSCKEKTEQPGTGEKLCSYLCDFEVVHIKMKAPQRRKFTWYWICADSDYVMETTLTENINIHIVFSIQNNILYSFVPTVVYITCSSLHTVNEIEMHKLQAENAVFVCLPGKHEFLALTLKRFLK